MVEEENMFKWKKLSQLWACRSTNSRFEITRIVGDVCSTGAADV